MSTTCPFNTRWGAAGYKHPEREGEYRVVITNVGQTLWKVTLQSVLDPNVRVEVRSTDPFFEVMAWERVPVMRGAG